MDRLKVTGVPEHFNLPWHLAIEEELFDKAGVDLEWRVEKGGTGAMTRALDEGKTDLAVLLTEGIVSAISKGSNSRILQKYIESPLIWGIHTGSESALRSIDDMAGKTYAISRKGSGSHLMAQVDAINRDLEISEEQWQLVGNLEGALVSLEQNDSQIFFWEKFTTLPYVKSGTLRRIGESVTPWPCFVIAASKEALEEKSESIKKVLTIINERALKFMHQEDAVKLVSLRYGLNEQEASTWFYQTEWACNNSVSWRMLRNVSQTLLRCGITDTDLSPAGLCSKLTKLNP